jgi:hypothetical protein
MCAKLKSFKILQISPNGCVYFDYFAYLKTYKRYNFSKKSLYTNLSDKKETTLTTSTFFYKKYRNQIIKKLKNEFTINCKKYTQFISNMSFGKNSIIQTRDSSSSKAK